MKYDSFRYYYPPRADGKPMPAALLPGWEERGYWASIKKNGTCNLIDITPDREIICKTRHPAIEKGDHRAWKPDNRTVRPFLNLPGTGWYKFLGELMNGKVKGIRHINYIHDILVCDGEPLVGMTFAERQKILAELFPNTTAPDPKDAELYGIGYTMIDEHTWLAKNYLPSTNYFNLFRSLTAPADEGLVLKKPTATLAICAREDSNTSWQTKVRRPTTTNHF